MKFKEMQKPKENLVVVDSLNLAFRWKHRNTKTFASDYLQTINSLARSYGAKQTILLGDHGSSWRKDFYPEYKANRETLKEKQTKQEAQDFQDFIEEYTRAIELCEQSGYVFIRLKGIEADDIAAYITQEQREFYPHIWLLSSDKDWDLLLASNVSRFSYVTRKEYTIENFESHYEYPVQYHLGVKTLMGDKGDNVAGVDQVGPKRAYTLMKDYDGDIFSLIEDLPLEGKYKYIKNINEFGKDRLYKNIQVMSLKDYCEDAILFEDEYNLTLIDEVL